MSSCCRLHIHIPMDEVLPEGPGEMGRGRHDEGAEAKGNEDHGSCLQGNKLEIEEDGDTVRKEETSSGAVAMTRAKSASGRKPRTKGLVKKLQEQIDFYFGDANLPKDKFLQQKIKEHPNRYVAIDVIASFKKIKALTLERALILKAIQNSSIVELSEDKLCLRRVTPLPSTSRDEVDARTIYVENLSPQDTDHDSLRSMFKLFGSVTYVSLPKHKDSGQIKGFAFIEYSTAEEAKSALEYFANRDKQPRSGKTSVINRKGSGTEDDNDKGYGATEADGVSVSQEPSDTAEIAMEEEGSKRGEKRRRDEGEGEADDGVPLSKRQKPDSQDSGPVTGEDQQLAGEASLSRKQGCDKNEESEVVVMSESACLNSSRLDYQGSDTDLDLTLGEEKEEPKKKRNRQHKKKQWAAILRDLNLRVMSKNDWLEMKKIYKDLQKAHMKQLKTEVASCSSNKRAAASSSIKGFVGNCLLKVNCSAEGGADVEQLKGFCSKFGEVAYMDIKKEDKEGYIRFRESGCVDTLLQSEGLPDVLFSGVEEEDERAYYLKSQAKRKQKYLKWGRNTRGRDKLISKVLRSHQPVAAVSSTSTTISSDDGPVRKTNKKAEKDSSKEPTHIRFSDDSDSDSTTT